MKVSVRSLQDGVLFDGDAVSVNTKTAIGEITVLDGHRPLISVLVKGNLVLTDAKNIEHRFAVPSGFLEVGAHNTLIALID